MNLPSDFLIKMKALLQDEFDAFLTSYQKPLFQGIRLNSLKCEENVLRNSLPFELKKANFSKNSFYCEHEKIGSLPAHHAGMFYAQEPSASSAVTVLAPVPGDKVLDLCAAPGGKSTQIAASLQGEGLLWSNEIVGARAHILLSNIERMGIKNAVVSSVHPEKLCEKLTGFFDKVLVDAPCSGEGMFKKEPEAVSAWSKKAVIACAVRQQSILDSAAKAVKCGGTLVYSTCTFSKEENEDTIEAFLQNHKEFEIEEISVPFGRPAFGIPAIRIFPMDGGEGHFVCKMKRTTENICHVSSFSMPNKQAELSFVKDFFDSALINFPKERILALGDKILLIPDELPQIQGLNVLRAGVLLGEIKKNRLEPAHAFFMSRKPEDFQNKIQFSAESEILHSFLKGEEIDSQGKGYTAVCVENVTVGFGKSSCGKLKNKYPKGLRLK